MNLILGSQSVGRKKVLTDAGYRFTIMPADIDEKSIRSDNYELLPILIARAKAEKLIPQIAKPSILITSDQIVVCNGELREKPVSESQARHYLQSYNFYPAQTNTAVVVTNTLTGKQAKRLDISKTYFKSLTKDKIDEIINSGKSMNTAGGFLSEDPLFIPLIDRIEGDPTGVLGLPLELTRELIEKVSS